MDGQEFEKFYWATYPALLRFVSRQGFSEDAQDIVANAFLTLWRKDVPAAVTDDEHRQLRALAFEVVRGHLRNERRSRSRRRALADRLKAQSMPPRPSSSASDATAAALLEALTLRDREIVLLVHAGFRGGEIAQILGISRAAAEKRQTRVRLRLRAMTDGERQAHGD